MHIIAIIVAVLIMVPAALAGIVSGLAQCLSHRPDVGAIAEHAEALLVTLGPFGSGVLLVLASLGLLVVITAIIVR